MMLDRSSEAPSASRTTDPVTASLADRVRAERERRGWSIADLAERSGVSRAMISKIERAEASPTAELLNRLCVGFGITLSTIFAAPPAASPLARRADQPEWRDPATGYVRRNVSPPGAETAFQIVEVAFPARAKVTLDAYRDHGVEQQVWMLEGRLELSAGGTAHSLEAGDCLAMRLDRPVTFENRTDRPARYAVVVGAPRSLA